MKTLALDWTSTACPVGSDAMTCPIVGDYKALLIERLRHSGHSLLPVLPAEAAPARNRTLQTFHDPLVWRELVRGDRLRVMRGRFEGQLAPFEGMAGRERVAVLLALMRGEWRVLLPRKAVERYRSGQAAHERVESVGSQNVAARRRARTIELSSDDVERRASEGGGGE